MAINVIIPVYRGHGKVNNALNSLLTQTLKTFYVTLVVDGDGENYDDLVDEYERRGLNISIIYSKTNGGPGTARQIGIDHSSMFDYLYFLDQDDMLYPHCLKDLYSEAKKKNADIIDAGFVTERDGEPPQPITIRQNKITWVHGRLYRRQYLIDNDIRFLPDLRLNEDAYFNVVAMNCTTNKYSLDEPVMIWCNNKDSLTRDKKGEDWFIKAWEGYIQSQCYGLRKIYDLLGEVKPGLLAAELYNIYEHYMLAVIQKLPTDVADNYIHSMLTGANFILDKADNYDFWSWISENVKQSVWYKGDLHFFPVRFINWYNVFCKGENNA